MSGYHNRWGSNVGNNQYTMANSPPHTVANNTITTASNPVHAVTVSNVLYPYVTTNNMYTTANNLYTTPHNSYATATYPYTATGNVYTKANCHYTAANDSYPTANCPFAMASMANSLYELNNIPYTMPYTLPIHPYPVHSSTYTMANHSYTMENNPYVTPTTSSSYAVYNPYAVQKPYSVDLGSDPSTFTPSTSSAFGPTPMIPPSHHFIGVIQMTATEDKEKNMATCNRLIAEAMMQKVEMIFLPEAFDFIGRTKIESAQLAEGLDGPVISNYKQQARWNKVWLSLGGFHEKTNQIREDGEHYLRNSHIIINHLGEIVAKYDKVHLFDMSRPIGDVLLKESDVIVPGNKIEAPCLTPVGPIGLGICYDMRFPEFALHHRLAGACILTYPSAFTVPTGKAHWEPLIRARAIESQCYVVCAAQQGIHNSKRQSYGHAMVVDPWGQILAEAQSGTELMIVPIDMNAVDDVRSRMPVVQHRRPSMYGLDQGQLFTIPLGVNNEKTFNFGSNLVKMGNVFLESNRSRAFVNRKCVLPGHVLVVPQTRRRRLEQVAPADLNDLFQLVQMVAKVMEGLHGCTSNTVCIQDGSAAGQTIPEVHIHVIPRKPHDFSNNDDIYTAIFNHDKGENIQWRGEREMFEESYNIRKYIFEMYQNQLSQTANLECICCEFKGED